MSGDDLRVGQWDVHSAQIELSAASVFWQTRAGELNYGSSGYLKSVINKVGALEFGK